VAGELGGSEQPGGARAYNQDVVSSHSIIPRCRKRHYDARIALVLALKSSILDHVVDGNLQQVALERFAKVEQFQRKHRVELLTLLFTDIVDSTRLKQTLGDREAVAVIRRHHALIREILDQFSEGEEINVAGDSFFIVFTKPSDAVKFSFLVQARLRALSAEAGRPVLDRIGIHVGEVWLDNEKRAGKAGHLYEELDSGAVAHPTAASVEPEVKARVLAALEYAFDEIDALQLIFLRLVYFEGVNQNDIAIVFDCDGSTISRQLNDGLKVLRSKINSFQQRSADSFKPEWSDILAICQSPPDFLYEN
jgi:Adenylate and Guanylate cyclase catalytic domain